MQPSHGPHGRSSQENSRREALHCSIFSAPTIRPGCVRQSFSLHPVVPQLPQPTSGRTQTTARWKAHPHSLNPYCPAVLSRSTRSRRTRRIRSFIHLRPALRRLQRRRPSRRLPHDCPAIPARALRPIAPPWTCSRTCSPPTRTAHRGFPFTPFRRPSQPARETTRSRCSDHSQRHRRFPKISCSSTPTTSRAARSAGGGSTRSRCEPCCLYTVPTSTCCTALPCLRRQKRRTCSSTSSTRCSRPNPGCR